MYDMPYLVSDQIFAILFKSILVRNYVVTARCRLSWYRFLAVECGTYDGVRRIQ